MKVRYLDLEGDEINIETSKDLKEAYLYFDQFEGKKLLKFLISTSQLELSNLSDLQSYELLRESHADSLVKSEYLSENSVENSVISEEKDLATSVELRESSPEVMNYKE